MIKGVKTLIKLRKRSLDVLRRKMADMQKQKEDLHQMITNLQNELSYELELSGKQPEMAHFYGDFANRIRLKQETAVKEIIVLDQEMQVLSGEIAEAFAEVKKFEIYQENTEERAREKEKRRETIELDDMAAQRYIMKEETS